MGIGFRFICLCTKPTPSNSGMVKSQVTTSGFSSSTICSASSPFRAMPTTSMYGLRESISFTTFLTKAESSTIRVLMIISVLDQLPK